MNTVLILSIVAVLAAIGAYIWLAIGFNRSTINVNQINARGTGSLDVEGVGINDGTITADTINEKTSGAGVDVEGVAHLDGSVRQARSTVTQLTSISTAVTINAPVGQITTVSTAIAADGTASFTVNNTFAKADSVIALSVSYGGAGNIQPKWASKADGSFVITLKNTDAAVATNNVAVIDFTLS